VRRKRRKEYGERQEHPQSQLRPCTQRSVVRWQYSYKRCAIATAPQLQTAEKPQQKVLSLEMWGDKAREMPLKQVLILIIPCISMGGHLSINFQGTVHT